MESLIGRGIAMIILVVLIVGVVIVGIKIKHDSQVSNQGDADVRNAYLYDESGRCV